jgi:hypothetical protein
MIRPTDVLAAIGEDGLAHPVSLESLRGTGALSVRDLGAVGDGRRHPLRERYRSLVAARSDFPHANSLDDEIDWAATQGAINQLAASGGGQVFSPAGIYVCNRTLTFPESREFGRAGVQVNWLGAGALSTIYRWPDDLGPNAFAVHCPNRYASDGMYEGLWQDLGLEGPGTPYDAQQALGVPPARMHGWGWGARRRMTRCWARGFRVGLDIVGDHSRFEDVVCRENFYNLYFPQRSRYLFGDLLFEKCMFSGCTMAAVAVHPAAQMGGCTMISCYMGGGPYAILKEAGGGEEVMVGQSLFLNCMFEYVGNAWLQDENTPRRAVVRNTTFDTCYFQWHDPNRLTAGGRRRRAVWDFHRADHLRWLQPKEPFALKPGDEALLCVEASHACEILGHIGHLVHNARVAQRPLLHSDAVRLHGHRSWKLEEPGEWGGRFLQVAPESAPVRQGDVLEMAAMGQVRRGTAGPAPVAGICMQDAAPGELTIVAVTAASLLVRCAGIVTDGFLSKGEGGAATAMTDGTGAEAFGWANGGRQGQAFVALRGLA